MSRYLIVKFDGNYADEFDVSAYKIFTEEQWQKFQNYLKDVHGMIDLYFGTNENLEYDNGKSFLSACSVHRQNYTEDEISVLETFDLNLDQFGIFENVIENYTTGEFYNENYN